MSVAWSPDGKQIASGSRDETIKIWDSRSGDFQSTVRGHSEDNPECTCKHNAGTFKNDYQANPDCPVTGHSKGCVICMDILEKITKNVSCVLCKTLEKVTFG